MTQTKTGTIEFEDGKTYYEVAGEGRPVVFVHAGFVDGRMWNTQWDALAKHFQVIRFDMRGFGKSDPVTKPLARREEVLRMLTQLGIEQATLIGCSLGGEVVLDFALEHPEQVSALVLVSAVPGSFEMQGEPPRYLMEMMGAVQAGDLDRASELQNRIWIDGMYREPDQVDSTMRVLAAEMNKIALANGTFMKSEANPADPLTPPAATRLRQINIPTLIIDGALDHPEILRAGDVMVKEMKDAHKVVLEGAAHLPNMEKPEEFNKAVIEFLKG
jgi:pimeloyl-ACP methyl ester carboxylesterase